MLRPGVLNSITKYTSLISGIWLMCVVGNFYAYSSYSNILSKNLGYDTSRLMAIPMIATLGTIFGGIIFGHIQDYWGPNINASISGIVLTLGFALMYLANHKIISYNFILFATYYGFTAAGSNGGYHAALVVNINNFSEKQKGKITGLLVCIYGLSSTLISLIFREVLYFDVDLLMLFMAFLSAAVSLTAVFSLHDVRKNKLKIPEDSGNEKNSNRKKIHHHNKDTTKKNDDDDDDESTKMLDSRISPREDHCDINLSKEKCDPNIDDNNNNNDDDDDGGKVDLGNGEPLVPGSLKVKIKAAPFKAIYGELFYNTLAKCPAFWLLIVYALLNTCIGFSFINLLGPINTSLPGNLDATYPVIIISIGNALSRALLGIITDFTKCPNILYLFPASTLLTIGFSISAIFPSRIALSISSGIIGLAYGSLNLLIPIVYRDYFGTKHYSSNLNLNVFTVAIFGSLAALLWGLVADVIKGSSKEVMCIGRHCFLGYFIVSALLTTSGMIICIVLYRLENKKKKALIKG